MRELELSSLERLKWAASRRDDILIFEQYLDPEAKVALMAACDCYVSLHRSEGFGLTLAEAMALGKPVIATGYSGNLEFMTPETSYLVPWSLGTVPPGCKPLPCRGALGGAGPGCVHHATSLRVPIQR